MPNSNRDGIHAINEGLGEGVDFILSGVDAIINAGVDVSLNSGYVFLNGETLKVDAQVVPRTAGTDLYQFAKVTTNPSEGQRNFRDGSTKNVYEENRAIAVEDQLPFDPPRLRHPVFPFVSRSRHARRRPRSSPEAPLQAGP